MDYWYSIAIGDGMVAVEPSQEITKTFDAEFESAGKPAGMAIFTRHESEGRLHCEVFAYFSPAASKVALRLGAQPCPKPARAGLGLLAGVPECWDILFPHEMKLLE